MLAVDAYAVGYNIGQGGREPALAGHLPLPEGHAMVNREQKGANYQGYPQRRGGIVGIPQALPVGLGRFGLG